MEELEWKILIPSYSAAWEQNTHQTQSELRAADLLGNFHPGFRLRCRVLSQTHLLVLVHGTVQPGTGDVAQDGALGAERQRQSSVGLGIHTLKSTAGRSGVAFESAFTRNDA